MTTALDQKTTEAALAVAVSDADALAAVRKEIDRIDAALLALLAERFEAVQEVRRIKGEEAAHLPPLRPSREAEVMRRLLSLRRDPLPAEVVIAVWREIMGTASQIQKTTRIHMPRATNGESGFRDGVRASFGSLAPLVEHETAGEAVAMLATHPQDLAAVPLKSTGWAEQLRGRNDNLAVVARVPFKSGAAEADGFVIGHVPGSPTGDDETLVAVVTQDDSPPTLSGQDLRALWRSEISEAMGGWLWLGILPGWMSEDDVRQYLATGTSGVLAVDVLGRYATPIR